LIATGTPPISGHSVHAIGLFQRTLFTQSEKRADLFIFMLDASVVLLGQRERGRLALLHRGTGHIDGKRS
jgi:hypothetical protein